MTKTLKTMLIVLGLVGVGAPASLAATLTVEKDGSGDYTIIQDALDAAAPGDSILIGGGGLRRFGLATQCRTDRRLRGSCG